MVIIRDDVVAWYELQRQEESGKTWDEHAQLDGTVNGATLSNDAPSNKFIGSHDLGTRAQGRYITLSDDFDYIQNTGVFTIEFFWKPNDYTNDNFHYIYGSNGGSTGNKGVALFYENRSSQGSPAHIRCFGTDGSTTLWNVTSSTNSINSNTWYHIRVRGDGTNVYIDINNVQDGSASIGTLSTGASTYNLQIGGGGNDSGTSQGNLVGLKFLNKHTTSTERDTLYNSGDGITYREQFAMSDDLEAYYKLDGDATDATGNGNNGTINGATSTSDSKIGTAYSFDGTNDYVNIPYSSSLDVGAGSNTISAWFKAPSLTSVQSIFATYQYFDYTIWNIQLSNTGTVEGVWRDGGIDIVKLESSNTYDDNNWHHAVSVRDGNNFYLYVDNTLVAQTTSSTIGDVVTPNNIFGIGANYNNNINAWKNFFNGNIDEVTIYSRALSSSEVRRLHSFGAALRYEDLDNTSPLVDGVVVAYNFDNDVLDAKNNTYDGTNNGTTDVAGVVDRGRNFDGVDDKINTNYNTNKDDFSIGVWINPDNISSIERVITNYSGAGSANGEFLMDIVSSKIRWLIFDSTDTNISSTTTLVNSTWYQVGGAFSAGNFSKVIINGVEETSSTSVVSSRTSSANDWVMGEDTIEGSSPEYFNGQMDTPTIWGRALSSTEWNSFYNSGSGTQFPFLESTPPFTIVTNPATNISLNGVNLNGEVSDL